MVVEACGALLPLLKPDSDGRDALRDVLQRRCVDADPDVQLAAMQHLATVLPSQRSLACYPSLEDLVVRLAADPSPAVTDLLLHGLLPALLRRLTGGWVSDASHADIHPEQQHPAGVRLAAAAENSEAGEPKRAAWLAENQGPIDGDQGPSEEQGVVLYGSLLPRVVEALQAVLLRCPYMPGTDGVLVQRGEAELRGVSDATAAQVRLAAAALCVSGGFVSLSLPAALLVSVWVLVGSNVVFFVCRGCVVVCVMDGCFVVCVCSARLSPHDDHVLGCHHC